MKDKHYVLTEGPEEILQNLVGQSCEHLASERHDRREVTPSQILTLLHYGREAFNGSTKFRDVFP